MPTLRTSQAFARRIDWQAVDGLNGTYDSLAYRVHEIERHVHNTGLCYGNNGANNLQATSCVPFRITSGNPAGSWGSELQIHDGAIIESGSATKRFDFHAVYFCDLQAATEEYCVQFWMGTGLFGAATLATETYVRRTTTKGDLSRQVVVCPRFTCNNKIWARCKSRSTASQWCDFLIEVHTYVA